LFQAEFESVFRAYDDMASFQYLKSFRRARVVFDSQKAAKSAKINLHRTNVCGHVIYCYYSHVVSWVLNWYCLTAQGIYMYCMECNVIKANYTVKVKTLFW